MSYRSNTVLERNPELKWNEHGYLTKIKYNVGDRVEVLNHYNERVFNNAGILEQRSRKFWDKATISECTSVGKGFDYRVEYD